MVGVLERRRPRGGMRVAECRGAAPGPAAFLTPTSGRRIFPDEAQVYPALLPRPALRRGLSRFRGSEVTYFAYLDEFGHIGPYVDRSHPRYKESPVFGLAGFVLPSEEVRSFGTWFFQRKCELLDFEIKRAGTHPARWEKKGASLYTATNVTRYPELRRFTNRLFNRIHAGGGFVFYVGIAKRMAPGAHAPKRLYARVFLEAIKRIDESCGEDCDPPENFALFLDEHEQRSALVAEAARSMYARHARRRHLIEPPFHLESHRYQTLQAADWIAGLVGRIGAFWAAPGAWPENEVFRRYFERRLHYASERSGIRR